MTIVALIAGLQVTGGGIDLVGLYMLAFLREHGGDAVRHAASRCGCARCRPGPLIQMPAFLLLFLAPVWVPYDLLTGWVHAAASVNPLTLVLETERGFLVGDPTKVLPAFAVVLLLVGVTRPVGARRPPERRARRLAALRFAHGRRGS